MRRIAVSTPVLAIPVLAALIFVGEMMAPMPASAACAAFVCNHDACQYHVISSTGPRMVRLDRGEREVLSGLGFDAAYCDWARGRCVTPRRPVRSVGAC
jgi:hypothetical protein